MAKKPIFNIRSESFQEETALLAPSTAPKNFSRNMVGSYADKDGSWHVVECKFDPESGATTDYKDQNVGHHILELEERLNIKLSQLGFFEEDYVNE